MDAEKAETLNWQIIVSTGLTLGWPLADVLSATLPELMLGVRVWKRANGLDEEPSKSMTKERLLSLMEEYS